MHLTYCISTLLHTAFGTASFCTFLFLISMVFIWLLILSTLNCSLRLFSYMLPHLLNHFHLLVFCRLEVWGSHWDSSHTCESKLYLTFGQILTIVLQTTWNKPVKSKNCLTIYNSYKKVKKCGDLVYNVLTVNIS